eukprot:755964-Hanusia_phi.AAC.1
MIHDSSPGNVTVANLDRLRSPGETISSEDVKKKQFRPANSSSGKQAFEIKVHMPCSAQLTCIQQCKLKFQVVHNRVTCCHQGPTGDSP